ncbi:MAG: phosphatase PAP2 family protein [Gaiellaceae bacterium]
MSPERFLARPQRTLRLACAMLLLVLAWAFVVPDGTRAVDRQWWEWMEDTWSWAPASLGVAAMASSRTYLHAHWLSDVIAGGAWGWALALVVFAVAQLAASSAR